MEHSTENDAPFQDAETPDELLGQLVGAASMCWSNVSDAGVFDADRASALVDAALARLVALGWVDPPDDVFRASVIPPEVKEE